MVTPEKFGDQRQVFDQNKPLKIGKRKVEMRGIIIAAVLLFAIAGHPSLLSDPESILLISSAQTPANNTVTITNFKFTPKSLTIKAGAEVTWEVKEGAHNIIADKGFFESQTLSAGQKFSHKFVKPGIYQYYCSFHGSKGGHEMAGTIRVTR